MAKLSEATQMQVTAALDAVDRKVATQRSFDGAAQAVTDCLFTHFRDTSQLVRIFVTTPYKSLPEGMSAWVKNLASSKGVADGLTPDTQVLALAGSSGTKPDWNGRARSKGHVGIPLISQAFVNAIPMLARMIGSLSGDLSFLDTKDTGQLIKAMSKLSGKFYVPDASKTTDAQGRKVISDQAFVSANKIGSVFGVASASAMPSGALMALLIFSNENVPEKQVDCFQPALQRLRGGTARLVSAGNLFSG